MADPDRLIANAIIKALDKGDLNAPTVAFYLSASSRAVQLHLWNVIKSIVSYWAFRYEAGGYDEQDEKWMDQASRIRDILDE